MTTRRAHADRMIYIPGFFVRFPEVALAAFFVAFFFGATDLLAGAVVKCALTFAAT